MKCLGIIGGIGPESTIDYYKRIIDSLREDGRLTTPEMILYSINLEEILTLVAAQDWEKLVYLLVTKLKALQRAGADFAVIASNTPHVVFAEVQAKSPLPLISIVEATLEKSRELDIKKVGLLGTKFTMQSNFFSKIFAPAGISVVLPSEAEQTYIHDKLMSEIEIGIIRNETKQGLLAIIKRMQEDEQIDGVILGCTELPLIIEKSEFGIPFLNTTAIHVESIVKYYRRT